MIFLATLLSLKAIVMVRAPDFRPRGRRAGDEVARGRNGHLGCGAFLVPGSVGTEQMITFTDPRVIGYRSSRLLYRTQIPVKMEFLAGFIYDIVGIRAIKKEKNRTKRIAMLVGFPLIGIVLIILLLAL